MKNRISSKRRSDLGASLVEYTLTIVIVSIMGAAAFKAVGTNIGQQFQDVSDQLAGCEAGSGGPGVAQCLTTASAKW